MFNSTQLGVGLACVAIVGLLLATSSESSSSELDTELSVRPRDGGSEAVSVERRPVQVAPEISAEPRPVGECLSPKLMRGAEVVALGAYQGAIEIALGFAGEGDAVSTINVTAGRTGKPLILVLAAHDPVIWNLSGFPFDRLRAVIVYGYDPQGIAHVPDRVPVRFVTRANDGGACGSYASAYKGGKDLDRLNTQVEIATGRPIDTFYGGYDPAVLDADGQVNAASRPAELALSSIRASAIIGRDAIAPGETGLLQLVDAGAIRPAKQRDIDAFNAAAGRRSGSGHLAPYETERLYVRDSYVVLRATALPKGMYGAHSRSFIIPSGVPMPSDPGSHNSFYRMADGSCAGTAC